ncbi:MAG: cyclic nucleotide-binding domain-containing protein [Candidatus Coatesbacteria bacterium]|nr:MAG: cyclic nucleotide-binding domain-containing protein [Candidatus Coatesbacteria bacterium]
MIERDDLAKSRLLENFDEGELDMLRVVVEEVFYEPGELIIAEGAPGEKLYLVIDGRVSVTTDVDGVGKEELKLVEPGDFFGEMSLIDGSPISADVYARTKCRIFAIDRKSFERLIDKDMPTANKLLRGFVRSFCERSRETADKIEQFYRLSEFGKG